MTHFSTDTQEIDRFLREHSALFILIAIGPNGALDNLLKLNQRFPQIHFIYYYPTLNVNNFRYADFSVFSHIVVGEKRRKDLSDILLSLTKTYWKKIPYRKLGMVFDSLSPRLKRVMNYIETHELRDCSTNKIAGHLEISPGYFSQEFKRETELTFRTFMQKLIAHYEFLIFEKLDLSAKVASQILGYSELSSFSRSFKRRKGYPPSHQKNHRYLS